MERFAGRLKTVAGATAAARRLQKPAAIDENKAVTEDPVVTSTLNAAIEMKNATIAYSITVAPH
jgi:hypothetical protein